MRVILRLEDCYVGIEGTKLIVGNSCIERIWSFASGRPVSSSIVDKQHGKEWIKADARSAQFDFPMLPLNAKLAAVSVTACIDNDFGIALPHLRANIDMTFNGLTRTVRLSVRVYPSGAFIRHEISWLPEGQAVANEAITLELHSSAPDKNSSAVSLQLDDNNKQHTAAVRDYCERLELQELHCSWEAVCFRDQTDTNNNLVSRESGLLYKNEKRNLRGNILLLKNNLHSSGLLLIKESATPIGHLQDRGMDFSFQGLTLNVIGSGIGAEDLAQPEEIPSYGVTIGVFDGAAFSAYKLIHEYQRHIRHHKPERDSFVMSNTWGDRSKDGRITEEFLTAELHVAAKLGVDIFQIDDGWQKGVTSNSVHAQIAGGRWSDYYSGGGDFWSVHPERLPRGLTPVVELANRLGIKLGLWYSPDSANDYANWEKDIETLLRLHRVYGISAFKLDGIDIRSKAGEVRLLNILRHVVQSTRGKVDFNLDTTSQKRLGYFGNSQYGNIFLENRYTDWKNYYPHFTLRNLWTLAPYVSATKLQMEFLNVNRNQEQYMHDPLAPAACGQVYSYAAAAFANPLAWMELTGLEAGRIDDLSQAIHAIKPHHKDILAGHILPIGEEPNGTHWTGLQSITGDKSGYLLVMRELHSSPACLMKLWGTDTYGPAGTAARLSISEIVRMDKRDELTVNPGEPPVILEPNHRGEYEFSRPAPFTFAVYRYKTLN